MNPLLRLHRIGALAAALAALASPTLGQVRFHGEAAGATVRVMSWREIPFRTVVRQQYDYSCGSAALATLLTHHYGVATTEADAFRLMYAQGDQTLIRKVGFSMLDMKRYLAALGLRADGFRMTLDELADAGAPAIALINLGAYRHFVVIKGVSRDRVLVGDPALGLRTYTRAEFSQMWNGVVFALYPTKGAEPRFNLADEWSPWSTAPLRTAGAPDTMTTLTRDQLPLYQLTPIRVLDPIPPGGGL